MTTPALRERLRYLLITDRHASSRPLERTVEAALEAGFTAVQLREKDLPARDLCDLALRLRAIADRWGALLIVNDRVDVALACGADGAQLGWKSLSLAEARAAARGRLRFGVTAHNAGELGQAIDAKADWVLFGPVFPTPSKAGLVEPAGLEALSRAARRCPAPLLALGGIDESNARQVLEAGAAGLALIRAVCAAAEPLDAARRLIAAASAEPPN